MITIRLSNGTYRFSEIAFARRLCKMLNNRNWTTLAQAQAGLSALPFTASGWTNLKKALGELLFGSVGFPADLTANGVNTLLTDDELTDRNVAGGVT